MRPVSDYLRREIARFDPEVPIERAWMPPASWYTDPEFLAIEERAVFQRTWQPAVRATDVADPGSYASGCIGGMPWVVVRDELGELRAHHNVCRHKGREVVTGAGRAARLVCGYHAWTYDLDGTLRKAPRIAGIEEFESAQMSLAPMAVDTWGPWIFVNGDPYAAPLRPRVAALDATLEDGGWGALSFAGHREWSIGCNWKVYVDNYLDGGYHIPHMHPTLDAQLDMNSYSTQLFGEYSVQSSGAAAAGDARLTVDPAVRIGSGALYAWLFPNFMVNRYGPCLDSNYVVPVGADRCRVVYEFYFDEAAFDIDAAQFMEQSRAQADVTQREDIEICESVQVGLRSPTYDRGRYAPRVELGEHHFHRLLASSLRERCDLG